MDGATNERNSSRNLTDNLVKNQLSVSQIHIAMLK